jgi:hypothetical protein
MTRTKCVKPLLAGGLLCLVTLLAACGGGGGEDPAQAAAADSGTAAGSTAAGSGSASTTVLSETEALALAATQAAITAKAAADQIAAESTAQTKAASAASVDPLASAQALAMAQLAPSGGVTVSAAPTATAPNTLMVRARGSLADGVGPLMTVRVNGSVVASVEVRAATYADYNFATAVRAGDKVDIAFTNDAQIGGADRNLYIAYLSDGQQVLLPTMNGAVIDRGSGARAFDGLDTVAAQGTLWSNGALRLTWPAAPVVDAAALAKRQAAVRFLMQASFGPTPNAIEALLNQDYAGWVTQQVAQPSTPDFVNYIQASTRWAMLGGPRAAATPPSGWGASSGRRRRRRRTSCASARPSRCTRS